MKISSSLKTTVLASSVLATGLLLAACGPRYTQPQQVQASNPTVSYSYQSDQEIAQVNQQATAFCARYQSAPKAGVFNTDPQGHKVVSFECQQMPQAVMVAPQTVMVQQPLMVQQPVMVQQYNPNITYSYRNDQELADATRAAQNYCMSMGAQQVMSNVSNNSNGSRNVSFQCSR